MAEFASRPDKLICSISGNLPRWAREDPGLYWTSADEHSRANARLAWMFTVALPRELAAHDLTNLMKAIAEHLARIGSSKPGLSLTWSAALHEGFGRNPHCHVLVSCKIDDALIRSAKQWFKRASPVNAVGSGAPASRDLMGRRSWLFQVRRECAALINHALETAGCSERVTHRSNFVQGLKPLPGAHVAMSTSDGSFYSSQQARRNREHAELNQKLEDNEATLRTLKHAAQMASDEMRVADAMRARLVVRRDEEVEELRALPVVTDSDAAQRAAACLAATDREEEIKMHRNRITDKHFLDDLGRRLSTKWCLIRVGEKVCAVGDRGALLVIAPGYIALQAENHEQLRDWAAMVAWTGWKQPHLTCIADWLGQAEKMLSRLAVRWKNSAHQILSRG
jgi:hypothetical protein